MALDPQSAALIAQYDADKKARNAEFKSKYGFDLHSDGPSADSSTPASAINNPTLTQQWDNLSDSKTVTGPASGAPGEAPPKADAAPKTSSTTATGLCDFLNKHQQQLVKDGVYEVADEYNIVFAPPTLGASKMVPQGATDTSRTGMQNPKNAKEKVDPKTNSMQTTTRTISVTAGQQIIQVIDQIMKNSSYISDQQLFIIDKDGKEIPNPNNTNGQVAWYNVNLDATPIKYDNKRNDYAYKLTYVVVPFQVSNLQSQYFPQSKFRGLHKSYQYWFTGQNTEVTNFEQNYNHLFRLIMSGTFTDPKTVSNDSRIITRRIYQTASENSMQMGNDKSTEPAANAADYLYSPTDQSSIKLQIIGDPAWLEQGSTTMTTPDLPNVVFEPFLPDGSININSQQVFFDISWNKPQDYNLNTGLVPTTEKNRYGGAQLDQTYQAVKVKSTFSHGKFDQEVTGSGLIMNFDTGKTGAEAIPESGKSTDPTKSTAREDTNSSNPKSGDKNSSTDGTGASQSPQTSPPPLLTTSNGETVQSFTPDNSFPRPSGDTSQEMALDP